MRGAARHDHGVVAMGFAIATVLACAAGPTRAHVVYGTPTLSQLTHESDLVARARIIDPLSRVPLPDPLAREVVVVAEVLELLKGSYPEKRLEFVQHGHGSPEYEKGEEVAVFLKRVERSRELGEGAAASRIRASSCSTRACEQTSRQRCAPMRNSECSRPKPGRKLCIASRWSFLLPPI